MTPEEFVDYLEGVEDRIERGSFEEPLRDALPEVHKGFERNFLEAEDEQGIPWPLRKDNLPHPLLVLSGDLIEAARDTGNPGNISKVTERDLETGILGSVVPYAARHNEPFPEDWMPERQFLYANERTLSSAEERFAETSYEILF